MRRLAAIVFAVGIGIGVFALGAPKSEAAGQALYESQTCSLTNPGMVNVTLTWTGNNPSAIQQFLDVGMTGPSFGQGTFVSVGPFSGTTTSFTWSGAAPSSIFYMRINQQLPNGAWDPSQVFQLVTGDCSAVTASASQSTYSSPQAAYIYAPQTQQSAYMYAPQQGQQGAYIYSPQMQQGAYIYAPQQGQYYGMPQQPTTIYASQSTSPQRVFVTNDRGSALFTRY